MNMIGMAVRSTATRFCSSRPLRPGRETSSTRQLGTSARGCARNSCADSNVSGCQPSERINNSSDSRTEMSSSTTKTIGMACDLGDDFDWPGALDALIYTSSHSKRGIERVKQSRVAEWFEQALHGTLFEHSRADGLISVSGDEDDRNLLPAKFQFLLEIRSCHARHGDVQDQTPSLVDVIRLEELFRRRERMGRKAQLPEQVG